MCVWGGGMLTSRREKNIYIFSGERFKVYAATTINSAKQEIYSFIQREEAHLRRKESQQNVEV